MHQAAWFGSGAPYRSRGAVHGAAPARAGFVSCRCPRSRGQSSPRWHSRRDLGEARLSGWVKAEEWLFSTRAQGVQHRAPACGLR